LAQRGKILRTARAWPRPRRQRRNRIKFFLVQILIELFSRLLDRTRVAAVADDEQAGRGGTHEACRIRTVPTHDGRAALRILDDELIDERGIAR
jgi:hypothetical protein